jgi:hypothetical protein
MPRLIRLASAESQFSTARAGQIAWSGTLVRLMECRILYSDLLPQCYKDAPAVQLPVDSWRHSAVPARRAAMPRNNQTEVDVSRSISTVIPVQKDGGRSGLRFCSTIVAISPSTPQIP